MGLTPGTRLTRHEIVATLGAGGRGGVSHARDQALARDVAIKRRAARAFIAVVAVLANIASVTVAPVAADDPPAISVDDVSVVEGNSGTRTATFTVSLAAPSSQTVVVSYATADGTTTAAWSPAQIFVAGAIDIYGIGGELWPYPSTVAVSGVSGIITKVTVVLGAVFHGSTRDLDVMLEAPGGQKVLLMSDAGSGGTGIDGLTLKFDDAGAPFTASPLVSGTYRPTNLDDSQPSGPDLFPDPAPAGPYAGALSAFAGSSANGLWKLYVNDDVPETDGGGLNLWNLAFETTGAGSDYVAASGVLVFPPGTTRQSIAIGINADTEVEQDERFAVLLSTPLNGLIADGLGQGTIVNDDAAGASPPVAPPAPPAPPAAPPSPVPGAPVGLTAGVFDTTVWLDWNAPGSGAAPTGYVIEVGSTSGAADLLVQPIGTTLRTITATNVRPGTYFVRVRAGNALGLSPPSNEAVVIVPNGGGPPVPTSTPPASPMDLRATSVGSSVALAWSPQAGGGAPSFYVIEAGSLSGLSDLANLSTGTPVPSFQAGGVPSGTYFVRVRAGNAVGISAPSNEVVLVVGVLPP